MASGGKKKVGGCSARIAEFILVIFNIVFLLCGGVLLSFGIIALVDPSLIVNMLTWIPGFDDIQAIIDITGLLLSNAILMVVIGSVIFLISFLGCCGTRRQNKCMLTMYWLVVLLLVLFELAVIMWAAIEAEKIQQKVADLMYTALEANFVPVTLINGSVIMSNETAWEQIQFEHACCGARDYMDYTKFSSWKINYTLTVDEMPRYDITNASIPLSCCMQRSQYKIPNTTAEFIHPLACLISSPNSTEYRNTQGCYITLISEATANNFITTVVIAGLIAVEVVAIMLALGMQTKLNKIAPKKKSASKDPEPDYE